MDIVEKLKLKTYSSFDGVDIDKLHMSAITELVSLRDALTFILTCDHDQIMSEGMDRVRAVLKLAEGK